MKPTYEIESETSYSVGASPKLRGRASPFAVDIFRPRVGDAPSVEQLQAQELAAYPILGVVRATSALMNRWAIEAPGWGSFLAGFYAAFRPDSDTGPGAFRSYWHGDLASFRSYEKAAMAWLAWARNAAGAKAMRTGTR